MTRRHIKPCHILVFASAPGMCVWVFFKSMAWCKANVIFADKDYGHAGKEVGDSWKYVHEACLMSRLSEIFISTEAVVGWSARYRHLFICVLLILFYIGMQMACFLLNSFSLHPKEMTIQQVIMSILACIGFCSKYPNESLIHFYQRRSVASIFHWASIMVRLRCFRFLQYCGIVCCQSGDPLWFLSLSLSVSSSYLRDWFDSSAFYLPMWVSWSYHLRAVLHSHSCCRAFQTHSS